MTALAGGRKHHRRETTMNLGLDTLIVCVLIIVARIADVTFGTLRTVSIVQGRRALAWGLGFAEILIWVFAVSKVITNLDQPLYALCYAFGFATGNYVGLTLERYLAWGNQVLRVFTRKGFELADTLWAEGVPATVFEGDGRDDAVYLLYIQVPRRRLPRVARRVRELDRDCYYIVEDVRLTSTARAVVREPTGWRAILKKK
jgi:uncharacterized protein YebE (UPF0316 family)